MELEQADGEWDLWNMAGRGDAGDPYPGSSRNANFTAVPYGFNYSNIDGRFNFVSVTNIETNSFSADAYYTVVKNIPKEPKILAPDLGGFSSTRPTFFWDVSPLAESYIIQISEDGSFESGVKEFVLNSELDGINYLGKGFSFTLPESDELEKETFYYLRIGARNSLNSGEDIQWETGYHFDTILNGMNIWVERSDMPTARINLASTELNGKIYAMGGYNENGVSNKLEEYDPAIDTWTTKVNMPGTRERLGAAAVDGKIYAIGGSNGAGSVSTVYEYDPATDTWATKADMPEPVRGFGVAVLDGKIYVVGGIGNLGLSDKLQIYDPSTDTWEVRVSGYTPRAYLGAAAVNGKLYAIGGRIDEDDITTDEDDYGNPYYSIVEEYDPLSDEWLIKSDMPIESTAFGITVLNNKIYIVGGDSDYYGFLGTIYEYDPIEDYWVEKTSMKTDRAYLAAAATGVEIYAIGGARFPNSEYSDITAIEAYEPELSPPNVRFSFDDENAGRLMGITPEMEYSLDEGVSYVSAVENDQLLTGVEIENITAENDIRVRVKATESEPAGVRKLINITLGRPVDRVRANDTNNTLIGMDKYLEFSTDSTNWTRYNNNLPDLTGNITIYVRYTLYGTHLRGPISTFVFTAPRPDSGGSGGGGGGGGTAVATPNTSVLSMIDAAVIVGRTAANLYLNNEKYENVIVDIPNKASEQSAAIDTDVFSMLSEKGKGLVINSRNLTMTLSPDVLSNEQSSLDGVDTYFKLVAGSLNEQQIKDKADLLKQAGINGLTLADKNIFEFNAALVTSDIQQRVRSFNAPIKITISLKDSKLGSIDNDKLGVYYYNETTKAWDYIGGKFDAAAKTISFDTGHFSSFAVMEYEKTFEDITKHWAKTYIEKMASKHIAKGTNNKFEPESNITRAEFTSLLVRAIGLKDNKEGIKTSYSDVKEGKWYVSEINKAYSSGIAKKEDGVNFRPDAAITRVEIVVMITRALQYKGIVYKLSEDQIIQKLNQFDDYGQIAQSAREPFAIALDKGIVNGRTVDMISPKGSATRAEAIVMIYRLLNVK